MQIAALISNEGRTERRAVDASTGSLTIGRDCTCSIQLVGALVSRRHASVNLSGPTMQVSDSSRNGTLAGRTFVNNSSVEVPTATPLRIGEFEISLVVTDDVKLAQPPVQSPSVAADTPNAAKESPKATSESASGTGTNDTQTSVISRTGAQESPTRSPAQSLQRQDAVLLRRKIHRLLLEHLDLNAIQTKNAEDASLRPKVLTALRQIVASLQNRLGDEVDRDALVGEMADEALGLGPLEGLLADPAVTEIMVVDPDTIYVERSGKLTLTKVRFTDDERVRAVIERIVTPLGRRIDESSPIVDARLRDGSRVNAVIRPLALRGSAITIRKFSKSPLTLDQLVGFGALDQAMANFLTRSVIARKNVVIAGGTGSGKTTLLNVLSAAIPSDERIVTIEDAAELQLRQPHVVSLETRPANMEGKGEYSIRDLVKNALRMRPDRIVVGECRGGEALDMLQAMNTGHDGSLTTTHANSAREAIARLETLVLMAGLDLPVRAIREQIAGAVHVLVQQARLSDGSRKVTAITEITGVSEDGDVEMVPIFQFVRTGTASDGKVLGEFQATGFLPSFLRDFVVLGLVKAGERYL
ncbi:MAG TPA: ATPase, T2SS/T4P/T4SS family [Polyangiaceae bacterium]|nr:ATPase, T2SS/T4P/T4SS family [Polyangiaceae bacterium]